MDVSVSLRNRIIENGYNNNKKNGCALANKDSKLYNDILNATSELNTHIKNNQSLRARVIFLLNYNNINGLKTVNGWLSFDRKLDKFTDPFNKVSKGWVTSKKNLDVVGFYSKDETILILKNDDKYKSYLGKSKNRTLLKDDVKLYNSIYEYTKSLNNLNKNSNKFSTRILFLVKDNGEYDKIICSECKLNVTSVDMKTTYFVDRCYTCFKNCDDRYPKVGYFKSIYGEEWKIYHEEYKAKMTSYKVGSKTYYINKYGQEIGLVKYVEVVEKRIKNIMNLTSIKCSKISQELFWLIHQNMTETEKLECFFEELNEEFFIVDRQKAFFHYPDFKYKNKIIEYDGIYWHRKQVSRDLKRNENYKTMGYDLLILNEENYREGKKNKEVINECLNFLRNEN